MRLTWIFLPILITLLAGCSMTLPTSGADGAREPTGRAKGDQTRPDDFHITYEWQEGSLPPPHHYEYTITISPTGQGQIVMIPDYSMNEPPTWTETFTASVEEMDALYSTLVANGLLTRRWRAQDSPPVGGSSQSVTVLVRDRQIVIPSFVLSAQESSAAAIHAAIEAFVPQAIWNKLDAQREQYVQEHP
jgi:hypothetical protein